MSVQKLPIGVEGWVFCGRCLKRRRCSLAGFSSSDLFFFPTKQTDNSAYGPSQPGTGRVFAVGASVAAAPAKAWPKSLQGSEGRRSASAQSFSWSSPREFRAAETFRRRQRRNTALQRTAQESKKRLALPRNAKSEAQELRRMCFFVVERATLLT